MKAKGRSVVCSSGVCSNIKNTKAVAVGETSPEKSFRRDRDHNAGQNMANATLQWVNKFEWPTALDRQLAKSKEHYVK